jgi:hypothetical protein
MISILKKQQRNWKGAVWNGRRAMIARGWRKGCERKKQGGQGQRGIMFYVIFFSTLTVVFPCFFFSFKANARVKPAKTGHGPHSF